MMSLQIATSIVLAGALFGCAAEPGASKEPKDPSAVWAGQGPKVPLPPFAALLGTSCEEDVGLAIQWRCGNGKRVSIVIFAGYSEVTGEKSSQWLTAPDDPPPRSFVYPETPLAAATTSRSGLHADELVVYADGPYLWLKIVREIGEPYPRAVLLLADRRLLSQRDRTFLAETMALRSENDVYDDRALRRAILAQSVPVP